MSTTFGVLKWPIPLLACIIVWLGSPAFGSSWRGSCVNNLRQIDLAKRMYAQDWNSKDGDAVKPESLKPYLRNPNALVCPSGVKYTIGAIGTFPTCSVPGHSPEEYEKYHRARNNRKMFATTSSLFGLPLVLFGFGAFIRAKRNLRGFKTFLLVVISILIAMGYAYLMLIADVLNCMAYI